MTPVHDAACIGHDDVSAAEPTSDVTLGLLAGGRATRLGGIDKAWLRRDGVPQVLRLARRFDEQVAGVIVSANRNRELYEANGMNSVADRVDDAGPMGGLQALAHACTTRWLLTLPVDVIGVNECLLPSLASAAGACGASAIDDDGAQPLVALWPVDSLRSNSTDALARGDLSVHALQLHMAMRTVRFAGVRFGNLNTPADLAAAGICA